MPRSTTIKIRGGTAANIAAANPTPAAREPVYETDTRLLKLGDGTQAYASLGYVRPYVTATDRLLGRSTAGAGVAEEITCTSDARAILAASNVYAARAWVNFDGTANSSQNGTYSQSGTTVTVTTSTAHGLAANNNVFLDFTSGTGTDGNFTVTSVTSSTVFVVTHTVSATTSGNCTIVKNTIRASGNVSSVADHGVGLYHVNFTTALADANYCPVISSRRVVGWTDGGDQIARGLAINQYGFAIAHAESGSPADSDYICVAVFR